MASGAAVTSAATGPPGTGGPTSRRDRRRGRDGRRGRGVWWTLGIIAVVGLAYALVLRALYHQPGSAMEEGFVLVFPDRLLHGDLPNRDFLNLYGPGSIWVLALVDKLFGLTVFVERTVGLLQLIGTTVAVCLLVRWWGRSVVLTAGLLSVAFGAPAVGLTAVPWAGAVSEASGGRSGSSRSSVSRTRSCCARCTTRRDRRWKRASSSCSRTGCCTVTCRTATS
jgi:hypothetical protein